MHRRLHHPPFFAGATIKGKRERRRQKAGGHAPLIVGFPQPRIDQLVGSKVVPLGRWGTEPRCAHIRQVVRHNWIDPHLDGTSCRGSQERGAPPTATTCRALALGRPTRAARPPGSDLYPCASGTMKLSPETMAAKGTEVLCAFEPFRGHLLRGIPPKFPISHLTIR